jgi:hypothetical protein
VFFLTVIGCSSWFSRKLPGPLFDNVSLSFNAISELALGEQVKGHTQAFKEPGVPIPPGNVIFPPLPDSPFSLSGFRWFQYPASGVLLFLLSRERDSSRPFTLRFPVEVFFPFGFLTLLRDLYGP